MKDFTDAIKLDARTALLAQQLRFSLSSGKIPHAAEQLRPCVTPTEFMRHNYRSP